MMAVVVDDRDAVDLRDLEATAGAGKRRERAGGFLAADTGELERRERRARVAAVVLSRAARARPRRRARRARRAPPARPSDRTRSSSSASERNSLWWSSSTFVMTAIVAGRPKTVRSDSSPSTTSQPSPAPAFAPSCGTGAPISQAGSLPVSRRTNAIIAATVPLPCVPATTIERRSATSSARNSARVRPVTPGYALETTTSQPSGTTGSAAISTRTPSSPSRYGVRTRVPAADLGTPRLREPRVGRQPGAADADEPEPPSVKRLQGRSAPRRSRRPRSGAPRAALPRPSAQDASGRRASTARCPARLRGRARAP